jgi:RNA polymerase sigma-70 factor (ECF subfamily)
MSKGRKKDFLMDRDREFEHFFRKHQDSLFKVVFGYVAQREIAEDLVIETFVKIYDRWKKVRRMENPAGYLIRSGINHAKTYLKWGSKQRTVYISENEYSKAGDSPEMIYFLNQENRTLETELLRLKERERNIVLLKDLSGKKFQEIAHTLDIKLPTVKSIYRRAKIKLAEALEKIYEPR